MVNGLPGRAMWLFGRTKLIKVEGRGYSDADELSGDGAVRVADAVKGISPLPPKTTAFN
jgi:hypothetical protein